MDPVEGAGGSASRPKDHDEVAAGAPRPVGDRVDRPREEAPLTEEGLQVPRRGGVGEPPQAQGRRE
eukprot:7153117-Alexandrium_andersonii.AAC.1